MLTFSLIGCSSIAKNTTPTMKPQKIDANRTKKSPNQKKNATSISNDKRSVNGIFKVSYIDVSQADSILIQQGSSSMLIDVGNNADSEIVKSYMSNQGITKLDFLVRTHPHKDHIGKLDYVINSFQTGKIYMPKRTTTTKTFKNADNTIKSKGLKVTAPKPGQSFKLGKATCTVLTPSGSGYEDVNNESIVIKVTFGNNSFLFSGDAKDVSGNEMLSKGYDLKTGVLKVGQHGSYSSITQGFSNKVSPKYAVVSVGTHKENKDRLKVKNSSVYRTEESGTVIATSNGNIITFNSVTSPNTVNYNIIFKNDVFVGDSITLRMALYKYIDLSRLIAKGGATVTVIKSLLVASTIKAPTRVIISCGVNNLGVAKLNEADFKKQYSDLIVAAKKKYSTSKIIVEPIFKVATGSKLRNSEIITCNTIIKGLAASNKITFLDTSSIDVSSSGIRKGDGLHFNSNFYPIWLDFIAKRT